MATVISKPNTYSPAVEVERKLVGTNQYFIQISISHATPWINFDQFKVFVVVDWFCLFDLILNVPSTIFQLYRDGCSWVEPVLS